jgi:hypothetical protein
LVHASFFDVENLARIKNGIQQFVVPYDYETNKTKHTAQTTQGVWRFREDTFPLAKDRLRELLGAVVTHYTNACIIRCGPCSVVNYADDLVSAVIYAMALRQLQPSDEPSALHLSTLHNKLNELFGMESGRPGSYLYEACDLLLKMVKDELARRLRPKA